MTQKEEFKLCSEAERSSRNRARERQDILRTACDAMARAQVAFLEDKIPFPDELRRAHWAIKKWAFNTMKGTR